MNIVPILRLLIIMVTRDGRVLGRERAYLTWIIKKYGLPEDLLKELNDPPPLARVWAQIPYARDREMALDLLKIAMNIDGDASPEERAFFAEVVALNNPTSLADALVEHTNQVQMWRDLKQVALGLTRRLPFWVRFTWWFR